MSATMLDVEAVRSRYTALDRRLAFFDGPGGTQCPDEVIDAIARYLREDNANIGAPYGTSVRTVELVERAHATAGRFLSCHPDEVAFGPSMTSLNFLLTRALGRTLERGDEIVCTRLDHDANVAPWLELARGPRHRRPLRRSARRSLARPGRPGGAALRPHEGRRLPDRLERGRDDPRRRTSRRARARSRRARLGGRRPLRAARPDRRRRLGRRRAPLLAVQVLRPAHGHGSSASASCSRACARTRCARPPTSPSDAASSTARCNTSSSPASSPRSSTSTRSAGRRSWRASGSSARGSSTGSRRRRALRAADDGGARADVRLQSPGPHVRAGCA